MTITVLHCFNLPPPFYSHRRTLHALPHPPKQICTRRPRPITVALNDNSRKTNQKRHDNDDDDDPELSRRVFLAGVSATTAFTILAGYRFVIGEDVESRIKQRLLRRFPSLFPRESTPEERRVPLDPTFAQAYFDAVRTVSADMHLLPDADLITEEAAVRARAMPLFFSTPAPLPSPLRSTADPPWLNFLLYARLHVVAVRTSPQQRVDFSDRLARHTMRAFHTRPTRLRPEDARLHADLWANAVRDLLGELVHLGWISGFRLEGYDAGPGSLWQDEGRMTLTIYALDPVTIQAAQLIGEERFEEISPKVSAWICAFLRDSGIDKVSYEDYYLDDAYRPDPDQFKPSQLATQFDLALSLD